MTKYNLQHWLYSIINKQFGSEVKFERDSLHAIYKVNRHGFEITTNTLALNKVELWLKQELKKCNYIQDEDNSFIKVINDKKNYIYLHKNSFGSNHKPAIKVSIQQYSIGN
jgi:uncharacterized membrane protein YcaP (DUF421 family)